MPQPTDKQKEAVAALTRLAKQNLSDAGKRYGRGKPKGLAFPKIEKVNVDAELAKMFHVSKGYIHEVRKIKRFCEDYGHPEIYNQLRAGTLKMQETKRRCEGIMAALILESDSLSQK